MIERIRKYIESKRASRTEPVDLSARLQRSMDLPPHWKEETWAKIEKKLEQSLEKNQLPNINRIDSMRKPLWSWKSKVQIPFVLSAGSIVFVIFFIPFYYSDHETNENPETQLKRNSLARLISTQGEIYKNNKKTSFENGAEIRAGDHLVSREHARLRLLLSRKSILELEGDVDLSFDQHENDLVLRLESGILRAVIKDTLLRKRILIQTPDAKFRITGTTFVLAVERPGETYYCLCHGKMDYRKTDATEWKTLETRHHHALFFQRDATGVVREKPGELLYHDDATMEGLSRILEANKN